MWLAILVGAVFAVPFGLLVALPSLRIGDLYLALLTIGFALLVEQFVWTRNEYENFGAGVQIARPFGIGITDRLEMYAIVAVVFAVAAFAIVNLKRATSGLVFAAIRSSEPAATTSGMSIVRVKLVLFGVQRVRRRARRRPVRDRRRAPRSPSRSTRSSGIVWLAIVVTWGVRSVVGALLAGMIFAIAPQRLSIILVLVFFLVVSGVVTRLALRPRLPQRARRVGDGRARGRGGRGQRMDLGQRVERGLGQGDPRCARARRSRCWSGSGSRRHRSPTRPVRIGLLVVVAAIGVGLAFVLAGLDLGESARARCRRCCSASGPSPW